MSFIRGLVEGRLFGVLESDHGLLATRAGHLEGADLAGLLEKANGLLARIGANGSGRHDGHIGAFDREIGGGDGLDSNLITFEDRGLSHASRSR